MNYYKRHLGDYAKDTGHLTPLEHGVYTLLLDRYYSTERPIPEAEACRVARAQTAADRAAVASVLREYFRLVDGEWHHNYADRVIKEASEKAESNRKNGKKGGRPVTQTEPKDNPEITQMVPKDEPKKTLAISHKPLAISQEEEKQTCPKSRADGFQRFKDAYPRREAWGRGMRAWLNLNPDEGTVAAILAAIEWQKVCGCLQDHKADGRSLIPLPASYLNDKRWLDEKPRGSATGFFSEAA